MFIYYFVLSHSPKTQSRLNKFSGHKKNTKTNIIRIISDILLLSCFVFFYSFYSISVFSCFYTIIPYISSLYIIIPYKDMHCCPDRPRFHCLSMPDSEADSSQWLRTSSELLSQQLSRLSDIPSHTAAGKHIRSHRHF